ncbi:MAG TPA: hypothetical protein VMF30_02635 [Pirellulales bacterium]|nr:hypothetical protein [Pirellulales bacterium]
MENPNTPGQVALWSAANANLFQNNLATAAVQAAKNSDGTPVFPNFANTAIPFGSTINVTQPAPVVTGGKLAQASLAALAALGISSGTLSLLKLGQPPTAAPAASASAPAATAAPAEARNPPSPGAAPSGPITIEGFLNWELAPDGGTHGSIDSGSTRPAAAGP